MKPTVACRRLILVLACSALTGCSRQSPASPADSPAPAAEDFVQAEDATPEERRYLAFGREVMLALAARDYAKFCSQLSPHALARMSLNQFDPADDDAEFARRERQPRRNINLVLLPELMAAMEQRFGVPIRPQNLHVQSTEAHILAGQPKEGLDRLDIMLAIGNIPAEVPVALRKASLRGQLAVQLSPEQLAEAAKAYDTTPEELVKLESFRPYCNVKLVLIEEAGQLRVGYFEFLPPSMLD